MEATAVQGSPGRRFINYLLGTSIGALLVSIFYPIIRYIIPPAIPESSQLTVVAAKTTELKPNSGKVFQFGTEPGIVIETPAGEVRAFSAVCTHLGCTVQYRPDLQQIWCACHNGHYDLNGKNVSGPPPRPLERYTVNVRGQEIVVSKG
jgi:cytochrome b6-f complex iron-sulfur subunit